MDHVDTDRHSLTYSYAASNQLGAGSFVPCGRSADYLTIYLSLAVACRAALCHARDTGLRCNSTALRWRQGAAQAPSTDPAAHQTSGSAAVGSRRGTRSICSQRAHHPLRSANIMLITSYPHSTSFTTDATTLDFSTLRCGGLERYRAPAGALYGAPRRAAHREDDRIAAHSCTRRLRGSRCPSAARSS